MSRFANSGASRTPRQIITDLGGDPSEAQTQIARRAAALAVWAESIEAKLAAGEELDIAEFATVSNSLRRLFESLGLKRVPREVGIDFRTYIGTKPGETQGTTQGPGGRVATTAKPGNRLGPGVERPTRRSQQVETPV